MWTAEMEAQMRELYPTTPNRVLGEMFGKSGQAVRTKAGVMGLRKSGGLAKKDWTALHDRYLRMYYPKGDLERMSSVLGCSIKAMYQRVLKMGVRRDPALTNEWRRQWALNNADLLKQYQYKPGNIPVNAGKKQADYCTPEAIAKMSATQFSGGHVPHNTKPVGFEWLQVDGTVKVKIANMRHRLDWEYKHRIVYELHRGPIPDGYNVEFLDGDRQNYNIYNLVLRSRRENVIKNGKSDSAIAKRYLGAKTPDDVEFIKKNLPEVLDLKRAQLKVNGIIRTKTKAGKP